MGNNRCHKPRFGMIHTTIPVIYDDLDLDDGLFLGLSYLPTNKPTKQPANYLSIHLSIYLPLSTYLSIHLFMYMWENGFHVDENLFVVSIISYLFICLSIYSVYM